MRSTARHHKVVVSAGAHRHALRRQRAGRSSCAGAAPVLAAWGAGVDSTAMIIELFARREPPDVVLMADTGSERPETDAFVPIFRAWMNERCIENHVVRYEPKRFKHWPPYRTLLENLLTNGTLPSISFGRHSCSQKWKIAPQDAWAEQWPLARAAWDRGERVVKLIGYDCSPADSRRYAHREDHVDARYLYRYPLREWGWTRRDCIARIVAEGLPVPVKSSCFFCAGMKPDEVRTLPAAYLRLIVLIEARAAPRLRSVEGLWRSSVQGRGQSTPRPGSMTTFILEQQLLPADEVARISAEAPVDLLAFQEIAAKLSLEHRTSMQDWLAQFNAGIAA